MIRKMTDWVIQVFDFIKKRIKIILKDWGV